MGDSDVGRGDDHHALSAHEVVLLLGTDPQAGLSHAEARRRLEQYGVNRLPSGAGAGWLRRLARQFHNPLIYVLLVAGAAIGFPTIIPARVLGADAPSNKINIVQIGCVGL